MAGKIPQHFINQLLARIDIVEVIDQYVSLKKKGANHQACCPFHQEKSPSFTVNQQKQFYYCFGCGVHGNAIGFLMAYDHLEFVEAVEELARSANMEVPYEQGREPVKSEQPWYDLLNQAQQFYQLQLRQHPDASRAVSYLKQRGLSGQIAKLYALGYAPKGWDNLLQSLGSNPKQKELLLEAGLLIKNDQGRYYDRFRERVMFPIRDRRGRFIGFGGRVLSQEEQPKYLNSPETPVFHKGQELYGLYEAKQSLNNFTQIMVVEGYMDVIALAQYGVHYAVATLGTATTAEHLKILFKQCDNIIFCFDGDRAGRQAAWRALKVALPFMTGAYRLQFLFLPEDEDPDSLVRKEGKALFEQRLSQALPLASFLLQTLRQQVDLSSVDGKAKLINLATPYVKLIPSGPYASLLCQELAKLSQLNTVQVEAAIYGKQKPQVAPKPNIARRIVAANPTEQAIVWLLQYPQFIQGLPHPEINDGSPEAVLFNELFSLLQTNPEMRVGSILEHYKQRPEMKRLAELALLAPLFESEHAQQEFLDVIAKLKQQETTASLEALISKSKQQALNDAEKQRLRELLQQNKK